MAAHAACESIRWAFKEVIVDGRGSALELRSYLLTQEFIDLGGEFQHVQWLKRNESKDWVLQEQLVPYVELSQEEKDKDDLIVIEAVKVFLASAKFVAFEAAEVEGGEEEHS